MMDDVQRIKPVAHEPSIVKDCWNEKLFYLDGLCLSTTFYSCRYQNKLASPTIIEGRPCYECDKHKPKPIVTDIVDWINQFGKKPDTDGPETL